MIQAINAYRQQNGLNALTISPTLSLAAAMMSRDMATRQMMPSDHTDSSGRSPFTRMADCGYTFAGTKAENIGYGFGSAAGMLGGWKGSPGHNATLLLSSARAAGVARAFDALNRDYWTLDVGSYDDSGGTGLVPGAGQPQAPPTRTPTPAPGGNSTGLMGAVSFAIQLIGADGKPAQGDLSGYVFTLTPASGAGSYQTPPTNAQGATALNVPAGNYTITQQPRTGATLLGLAVGSTLISGISVGGGQTVNLVAMDQVTASAAPAATASPAPTAPPNSSPLASAPPAGASGSPSPTMESVELLATCNNVTLTYPAGTSLAMVAAAVAPADGLIAIWRLDTTKNQYLAYSPLADAPKDYTTTTSRFEPVFICMKMPGSLSRPAG